MGIKLYYTTVTASREVKSQQAEIMRILESKSIQFELIDISVGGDVRDEMRSKSGNPTAVPPQIFNEDQYCGNYEMFAEAVEDDKVEQFLKMA
ncbi:SH3 domain-binding glutamic acid-rich-like protein 3 [Engraulis encrasicolus]|uniref:SH3 domain-binding glutamic acid-rich-like protein 3 n=1 Tax=Engraulis encrasicolus TaxID=184585 RepID=UPI002FD56BE9